MTLPRRGAGVDGGSTGVRGRTVAARAHPPVGARRPTRVPASAPRTALATALAPVVPDPPPRRGPRRWRGVLLASLLAAPLLVTAHAAPAAADDPVVVADDERDVYVGHGGLLLPPTFHGSAGGRAAAASCAGCSWRLTEACLRDAGGSCNGTVSMCPPGEAYLRVWLLDPAAGGGWVRVGATCIGPRGPVTVADMGSAARDAFVRDLPALGPSAQPATAAVTQIPVVFGSGQPATWPDRAYDLLGFRVTVSAASRWTWRFGDGATLQTDAPGGRWPVDSVAHAYRAARTWTARVTTTWSATWTTDGLGPFPVAGPIRQDAAVEVPVGEGRAVLVGGP